MTQDEAIALARDIAAAEGWHWREPIVAIKSRLFVIVGPASWHVMSNSGVRGGNVNVHIDDLTGEVTSKGFAAR